MTFCLNRLPPHVIDQIYDDCISAHDKLTTVLSVNRALHDRHIESLYKQIKISNVGQLHRYGSAPGSQRWGRLTSKLSVYIAGGETARDLSTVVGRAVRCAPAVDEVDLTLYALRVDQARSDLISGLSQINPLRFSWASPDPNHQFVIAIFAAFLPPFLSHYTRLTHLSLSNISFAELNDPNRGEPTSEGAWNTFLLPQDVKDSLQTVHISRAVFLDARIVLALLENETSVSAEPEVPSLSAQMDGEDGIETKAQPLKLILEDVYLESIWGPRMRMSDLELAAQRAGIPMALLERVEIRSRFERIQGGDRMDG